MSHSSISLTLTYISYYDKLILKCKSNISLNNYLLNETELAER